MKAFADIADRKGLILYHHFYFQHWLLESRSHYVDFPWRPVNTIQDTGLPGRGAGGERVLRHQPTRCVATCIAATSATRSTCSADNTNVVHGIDREYTGSTRVRALLARHGRGVADGTRHGRCSSVSRSPRTRWMPSSRIPVRGRMITAIDVLGWVYRADGTLFASRGAINRAPREQRPDIATPDELDALKRKLGHFGARPEGLPQRPGVPAAVRYVVGEFDADEVPCVARVPRSVSARSSRCGRVTNTRR